MYKMSKGDKLVQIIIDIPDNNFKEVLNGFMSVETKNILRKEIKKHKNCIYCPSYLQFTSYGIELVKCKNVNCSNYKQNEKG